MPQVEVEVVVTEKGEPELYNVQLDDALEVGPFSGSGLDLRSSGAVAAFRCARRWRTQAPMYMYVCA